MHGDESDFINIGNAFVTNQNIIIGLGKFLLHVTCFVTNLMSLVVQILQ